MTTSSEAGSLPPVWTILYHGPITSEGHATSKGRAEFLRLMLEDKGVAYVNSDDNLYGPEGIMDAFRGSMEAIASDEKDSSIAFPLFFPPAIWHRPPGGEEVLVNQVGACIMYIGDVLDYATATSAERARANAITLNAIDYISEGRASFHPVKNFMSYSDQKEEGDRVSKEFTQERMKKFLHHFNKVVLKNGSNKPVAGGPNVTYADFALFYALDASISQFNTSFYDFAWDNTNVQALKDYHAWMKARPNLSSYLQSDRCPRKYAEITYLFACLASMHLSAHTWNLHYLSIRRSILAYCGDSMM
jgi:glutathione S-transferase